MAMFENEGYCLANSFLVYEGEINPNWKATRELLGDKIGFMVYAPDAFSTKESGYIVDLFMGGNSLLGYHLACIMQEWDPKTEYAVRGKMILVRNVINPGQIPNEANSYEDERYHVGLLNSHTTIGLFIYKK